MDINESFENFKSIATDTAQAAARKAKLLAFIAKSNVSIMAEQDKLKKAYTELGKLYYRDFVTDEEPDEAEYLPLCDRAKASIELIDSLKQGIEDAKREEAACSTKDQPKDADFTEEPEAAPNETEIVAEKAPEDDSAENE